MFAITAFVLAIVVPLFVAIALLIYVRSALSSTAQAVSGNYSSTVATLTTSYAQLSERIARIESDVKQSNATHLQGELAALAADVDSLAKSCRKQFGKLFAEAHHDGQQKRNGERQLDFVVDPDFESLLAFQSAPPPSVAKE